MRSALPWAIFSRSPGLRVVRSNPSTASCESPLLLVNPHGARGRTCCGVFSWLISGAVEKQFELALFGGAEVGEHLFVGSADGRFCTLQQRPALAGELSRQCTAQGRSRGTSHDADVLQPLQNLVHCLRRDVVVPGKLGAGPARVLIEDAHADELGQSQPERSQRLGRVGPQSRHQPAHQKAQRLILEFAHLIHAGTNHLLRRADWSAIDDLRTTNSVRAPGNRHADQLTRIKLLDTMDGAAYQLSRSNSSGRVS